MSKSETDKPEKFLTRWSTRKLASRMRPAQRDGGRASDDDSGMIEKTAAAAPSQDARQDQDGSAPDIAAAFDPAQLPPLDSISADTDVAAFLRKEVPPELTRAALRRAWTSDPAIRDFVGLVENGWDFNDPSAMPGFGAISAEEVARLAGKVIEVLPAPAPQQQVAEKSSGEKKSQLAGANPPPAELPDKPPKAAEPGCSDGHDAAQQNETDDKS